MTDPFVEYIRGWIQRYGTAQRLATAIGLSLSAFSRGVRNEHTLGIESILRFAKETGEPPDKVLRLAKKAQVADLLQDLYGPTAGKQGAFSAQHREVLRLWDELTDAERAPLLTLMKGLASKPSRRVTKRGA